MDWSNHMFVLILPVLEKILRPIIIYIFLVVGLRVAGKRELAQLNPFDLVVLLTLSNTVQNAIIGDDNTVTGGLIGATTLLLMNWLVVRLVHRNRKLNDLVEGKVDYLIRDGKINPVVLQREEISEEELAAAAHKEGFHSLEEIQEAALDPNGIFTFTAKENVIADTHQKELLDRMDQLTREIGSLRTEITRLNHLKAD
jgi:uncharacterized membrane protein YcaP (DUF421 family)